MDAPKSLFENVAHVTFHEGEPREIHFDVVQSVHHGFNFVRADGSFTFISAKLIAEMECKPQPGAKPVGSA